MKTLRHAIILSLNCASFSLCTVAVAEEIRHGAQCRAEDGTTVSDITQLTSRGAELGNKGDANEKRDPQLARQQFGEALSCFILAFETAPDATTARNIAYTLTKLGKQIHAAVEGKRGTASTLFEAHRHFVDAYNWLQESKRLSRSEGESPDTAQLIEWLKKAPGVTVIEIETPLEDTQLRVDDGPFRKYRSIAVVSGQKHLLVVTAPGHDDFQEEIPAIPPTNPLLVRPALKPKQVALAVRCDPRDASLTVNNIPMSCLAVMNQPPVFLNGSHVRLVATRGNYLEEVREVDISLDMPKVVLKLKRDPITVSAMAVNGITIVQLAHTTSPPTVRLDKEKMGIAPGTWRDLEPRNSGHVEVERVGYLPWSADVPLRPGQLTRIDVTLVPTPPPARRYIKWAGYGLGAGLAVSGLAVGLIAAHEKNTFSDNPSREQHDRINTLTSDANGLVTVGLVVLAATAAYHVIDYVLTPDSKGEWHFE